MNIFLFEEHDCSYSPSAFTVTPRHINQNLILRAMADRYLCDAGVTVAWIVAKYWTALCQTSITCVDKIYWHVVDGAIDICMWWQNIIIYILILIEFLAKVISCVELPFLAIVLILTLRTRLYVSLVLIVQWLLVQGMWLKFYRRIFQTKFRNRYLENVLWNSS